MGNLSLREPSPHVVLYFQISGRDSS
jgi:hypothetical protein